MGCRRSGASRRICAGAAAWALAGLGCTPAGTTPSDTPPNVVLIVFDDLGYGSLSHYSSPDGIGHDIIAPNLDRLAAEGLRLAEAYANSSVCSPKTGNVSLSRMLHCDTNWPF